MTEFPRTTIEDVSVSRMVIGTNWFMGSSHTSQAKDRLIRSHMDAHRIADVLEVFLKAGVDTILGKLDQDVMRDGMKMAEDRTGRGIIKIGTPGLDTSSAPEADDTNLRTLDQQVSNGLTFCYPTRALRMLSLIAATAASRASTR